MANTDLFKKINLNYKGFTNAERKVADYIQNNANQVIYMSITDLADACNVGDTSVFRFCKTLKLQGYQDFKMQLAQSISTDEQDTPQLTGKINRTDSMEAVAQKVLSADTSALNETYHLIDFPIISQVVDYIISAKRVYFFGVGASLITAMEAKDIFMRITPKVECMFDSHLQAMQASLMTKEDLAFAISYSGATKDTIQLAKLCKHNNARVVGITRFAKSPLTNYSDITLLCGANEGPLQSGSLSAKISQLYLLDVLYEEYFKRTFEISKESKEKTSGAVLEKLY